MPYMYESVPFGGSVYIFAKPTDYSPIENVARAAFSLGINDLFLLRPNEATGRCYVLDEGLHHVCKVDAYPGITVTTAPTYVDGIIAKRGIAIGILTADCPTIISQDMQSFEGGVRHPGRIFFGHGGRGSLVRKHNILNRDNLNKALASEGIIENLFNDFGWSRNDSRFFSVCGIASKSYCHPYEYPGQKPAGFNRLMIEYLQEKYREHKVISGDDRTRGQLDLVKIAEAQARTCGYRGSPFGSDGRDTFSHPLLWSRRAKDLGNTLIIFQG